MAAYAFCVNNGFYLGLIAWGGGKKKALFRRFRAFCLSICLSHFRIGLDNWFVRIATGTHKNQNR